MTCRCCVCQGSIWGVKEERNVLKAELPKREPLVWSAGHCRWSVDISNRMRTRAVIVGWGACEEMAEIGVDRIESVI